MRLHVFRGAASVAGPGVSDLRSIGVNKFEKIINIFPVSIMAMVDLHVYLIDLAINATQDWLS